MFNLAGSKSPLLVREDAATSSVAPLGGFKHSDSVISFDPSGEAASKENPTKSAESAAKKPKRKHSWSQTSERRASGPYIDMRGGIHSTLMPNPF